MNMFGVNNNHLFKSSTQPVEEVKIIDYKQLKCLADNIFFEANGEPIEGQAAVARVVLNRLQHGFASTICNVVYQTKTITKIDDYSLETVNEKHCQFHWVCEGKRNPNTNSFGYKKSLEVALEVLEKDMYSDIIPEHVLYFHNTTVNPDVKKTYKKQIGNHIFYSKNSK